MTEDVRTYLLQVCQVLNKHEVDYIVIGGTAVSYFGHNRPSGVQQFDSKAKADLDFWYKPSINNFNKIVKALSELGVDVSELKEIIFDPKRTFLKIPHQEFRTDFLPVMEGLDSFAASKSTAEKAVIDGITIPIISYADLIANKRTINRKLDQSDIESLENIRKKRSRGPKL